MQMDWLLTEIQFNEEGLIVHMISVAATQVRESPISYCELFDKLTTDFKECDG